MIDNEILIGLDIETSNGRGEGSLDARDPNSSIALMQFSLGEGEDNIRVMRAKEGMRLLKELNTINTRFIIHNAFFELDWFLHKYDFPIHTMKVWCPMTASQVLNAGKNIPDKASWISTRLNKKNIEYLGKWDPLLHENIENIEDAKSTKFTHNLQATIYRYANNVIVEKDQGNSDWANPNLTEEQLRYAKDDVRYLIEVARNQWNFVQKFGLEKVINLEMSLIPATVEMKKNGMKINKKKWMDFADQYKKRSEELEVDLNLRMGTELARRLDAMSLFGMVVPRAFNVSSSSQVAKYFNIESADESHLREIEDKDPLVKDVLEYRENFKSATTYGMNYLKFLGSDSRIHSMLVQTETATGRYCIAKGTVVEIAGNEPKATAIENVKPGDLVYTYDDNLNLTIKPVLWSGKTGHKKVIRVHWVDNTQPGFIDLTPEHRVRKSSGAYTEAENLSNGDSVLAFLNPALKNYEIRITRIEILDHAVDVYDLEVEDTHNFIANRVCVHNSSRSPNLQNVKREMLKECIDSDPGKILLAVDYSSMESRILAYAADDEAFIRAVNSEDVHWENAKNIFKLPENSTKNDNYYIEAFKKNIPGNELRRMAKGVSFG